ncbi:MAG: hypothetical protein SOX26_09085 [Phocaeicola sp.]|nr:hypothetical protein [Phocaeicola sp.]
MQAFPQKTHKTESRKRLLEIKSITVELASSLWILFSVFYGNCWGSMTAVGGNGCSKND